MGSAVADDVFFPELESERNTFGDGHCRERARRIESQGVGNRSHVSSI
jgi:hypothetical protein